MSSRQDNPSGIWGFLFILGCVGVALKYGAPALGLYTGWAIFGLAATAGLSAFLLVIVYDHWRSN